MGAALLAVVASPSLRAATLSGDVTREPEGGPDRDVVVYAIDERFGLAAEPVEADGSYRLAGLPAGSYRVWAVPGGDADRMSRVWPDSTDFCTAERIVLAAGEERAGIDFALQQGGAISGRLVGPDGLPRIGAVVTAESDGKTSTAMDRQSTTDEDGWFDILGLDAAPGEPKPWSLSVEADDLPDQVLVDGLSSYAAEDATWFAVGMGEVRDAGESTVLPGITVEGWVLGPDGEAIIDGTVHVYSESQIRSVSVQPDGRWSAIGLPPGAVLPWVSAGGYGVTYYPDHDRPTEWVDSPGEGSVLADLVLRPPIEATLTIALSASDGGDPNTSDWDGAGVLLYNDAFTVGRGDSVDADGRVTLDGLHAGRYFLHVFAAEEGFLDDWLLEDNGEMVAFDVTGATAMPTTPVRLERGAQVSGSVVDETGVPVYGASVVTIDEAGKIARRDTTGRDGRYGLIGVRGGSWKLAATYEPVCNVDGGYVTVYAPGTVNPARAAPVGLAPGEWREGLDFVMPRDGDLDEMGDAWERDNGLDPHRDDSADDPDGDGLDNLQEYRLGFDPHSPDTTTTSRCGCDERGADTAMLLPLLPLFGLRRKRR